MLKHKLFIPLLLLSLTLVLQSCSSPEKKEPAEYEIEAYSAGKPYTRWWWHAMKFTRSDIRDQLIWLRDQGFGGVEVAFIYPVNRNPEGERFEWLGKEWQEMVVYAKQCADSLGLGCDFTFGTLWPFGGTFVSDDDRTKIWGDSTFKQPLRLSWTHPDTGNVLDHLNRQAFRRYAEVMGKAFAPAMAGSQSALFCDSWEVETKHIWTDGFDKKFSDSFGYDIKPFMDSIYSDEFAGQRYDYMKMVAKLTLEEFYIPFHEEARRLGGISRAQCAGSPTDLIRAYSAIDVPETEAMLYEPNFSRVVASAATLAGKPYVSSESFTCLYGWPAVNMHKEQTADLKMVADALFANGVNQHIWHGTPFNPIGVDTIYFYATVHVGASSNFADEIAGFNEYLTKVSNHLRFGKTYSNIAVYLPSEDRWIEGELPEELQLPWAWGAYEHRYEYLPEELEGYHPTWVNADFLSQGKIEDNKLIINQNMFSLLYVDVNFLDLEALQVIHALASAGLPVCMKKIPLQAGYLKSPQFDELLTELKNMENFTGDLTTRFAGKPMVEGDDLPEFWCRTDKETAMLFFANPLSKRLKYPMQYGQSLQTDTITRNVIINYRGKSIPLTLIFEPYQSLLVRISNDGRLTFEDIRFVPETPAKL